MAKTHKRTERLVAQFLGGTRDWKELHDCSVADAYNRTWIIEVKSQAWPAGPGGLWTILDAARQQVMSAMQREGLTAEDWCYPCVVYWPTRCPHDGSAVAYAPVGAHGQWVVMPLWQFRDWYVFPEEETR